MENESNTKIISLKFKVKVAAFMILIIILISNIPLVTWFIDGISGNDYYAYSTGDGYCTLWCGSFKEYPYPNYMTLSTTKIDSTHDGEIIPVGKELRNLYPNADTVFYRLFWKNPFKFWHLYEYFSGDHKYDFPYKSWEEIEAKRPNNFKIDKFNQQF